MQCNIFLADLKREHNLKHAKVLIDIPMWHTTRVHIVPDLSGSGWMTNFKELLTVCVIGMVLFWNGPVGIVHPAVVSKSAAKQSVYCLQKNPQAMLNRGEHTNLGQ